MQHRRTTPGGTGRRERHKPVGKLRRFFIFAAIAGIVVVAAKKLGIMGGDDDEPMEYAPDPGMGDDSADGDEENAAN